MRDTDQVDTLVSQPRQVVGLGRSNWPLQIASGNSHSVAIAEAGGILVCGRVVLAGVAHMLDNSKFHYKGFKHIDSLKSTKFTHVACGDYHTVCITQDGLMCTWGGANNSNLQARPSI